ncbi:YkvS family protein [Bacillus thuringiensis]|uniref:YkvS family protein n=1 Tax=Bacillus thuringiensis TaxID=1428 RepID=UPI0021D68084|nr:YkvS family protein [Bacillus thuringiensis]MCU7666823.1 YkvS family protein [Bacillus thuringiensis]
MVTNTEEPKVKIAELGDVVKFERKEMELQGVVVKTTENAVIVDLKIMPNHESTEIENYRTVVNHKKYKIVTKNKK